MKHINLLKYTILFFLSSCTMNTPKNDLWMSCWNSAPKSDYEASHRKLATAAISKRFSVIESDTPATRGPFFRSNEKQFFAYFNVGFDKFFIIEISEEGKVKRENLYSSKGDVLK